MRSLAEVAQALEQGNVRRTVAAHNQNEFSSRSHAILQVQVVDHLVKSNVGRWWLLQQLSFEWAKSHFPASRQTLCHKARLTKGADSHIADQSDVAFQTCGM